MLQVPGIDIYQRRVRGGEEEEEEEEETGRERGLSWCCAQLAGDVKKTKQPLNRYCRGLSFTTRRTCEKNNSARSPVVPPMTALRV